MGYFSIGNFEIFYTDERFIEINQSFCENLTPHEKNHDENSWDRW